MRLVYWDTIGPNHSGRVGMYRVLAASMQKLFSIQSSFMVSRASCCSSGEPFMNTSWFHIFEMALL